MQRQIEKSFNRKGKFRIALPLERYGAMSAKPKLESRRLPNRMCFPISAPHSSYLLSQPRADSGLIPSFVYTSGDNGRSFLFWFKQDQPQMIMCGNKVLALLPYSNIYYCLPGITLPGCSCYLVICYML